MMKKLALFLFLFIFIFIFPSKAFATQAQLACSPTTSTISVGSTITADIILNTRSYQVTGANAILTYSTSVLNTTTADLVPVTTTTGWTSPLKKLVDASLGKIELDYGASQSAFTSSGTIGKITFTAKTAGNANVNFVFFGEYDNSTAGIAKVWGERQVGVKSNILTDVVNCVYTVTGGGGGGSSPTVTSTLPRTGNTQTTLVLAGAGIMLFIFGLFVPRYLSR